MQFLYEISRENMLHKQNKIRYNITLSAPASCTTHRYLHFNLSKSNASSENTISFHTLHFQCSVASVARHAHATRTRPGLRFVTIASACLNRQGFDALCALMSYDIAFYFVSSVIGRRPTWIVGSLGRITYIFLARES